MLSIQAGVVPATRLHVAHARSDGDRNVAGGGLRDTRESVGRGEDHPGLSQNSFVVWGVEQHPMANPLSMRREARMHHAHVGAD